MVAHGKEISGTGFLEKGYQPLRVPFFGFPFVDYILEAEFRRMSVMLQVPLVGSTALFLHAPTVAVAGFGLALRTPVCPYAEFGVAEPFGHFVLGQ